MESHYIEEGVSAQSPVTRQSSRQLHIVFVTASDLPEGGGGTSRIKSLTGAILEMGHSISILNEHGLGVSPTSAQNVRGMLSGVPYEYVLGTVDRGYGFAAVPCKCRAVIAIGNRLKKLRRAGKIDLLWFNNLSFYDTFPLTLLAKRLAIRTIQSYEDERLLLVTKGKLSLANRLFALDSQIADRYCPAMADALVVISSYLYEKYSRLVRDGSKMHLIPTIIDCRRWQCGPERLLDVPSVLYSGCLGEQDEIENVLRAMASLRDQGLQFRLVMFGGNKRQGEGDRELRVSSLIHDLQLTSIVERLGFVSLERVRHEIEKANILISIRRDSKWSQSGLSTKLSEYLASGRLVVSSKVGDVGRYLTNGDNALLVSEKCAVDEIAAALKQALLSPHLRASIGQRGRQVALTSFDVPVIQAKLQLLFDDICRKRPGTEAALSLSPV